MPTTQTSPNMGIVVPVPLSDTGPDWATRIQTALFATIDAHDHTSGKGVPITTAALNINADLGFGSFNATALRSSRYTSQGAPLALGPDVGCVYVSGGELWYNDTSARQVQLTATGAVKSAPQALSYKTVTTSYTISSTDPYQLFWLQSGSGATAIALPSSATVAVGRTYWLYDAGQISATNTTTITPNGADTINGVNAALAVNVNAGLTILTTDGAGHWSATTVPAQPEGSAFATQAITTGTVTLTAAQVLKGCVQFTGTLSGAVTVVVPNAVASYQFDFSAVVMGGNTVAIKSGSTTSATMAAANIGSTQTLTQLTFVQTYGGNTVRIKA